MKISEFSLLDKGKMRIRFEIIIFQELPIFCMIPRFFTFEVRVPPGSMSTTLNKLFYLTRKQLTCIDPNPASPKMGKDVRC